MATIAVFGSSATQPGSAEWADGLAVGRALAEAGLTVATGGYHGTMEAVSQGARTAGGHVIGVTADQLFPTRSGPNSFVTERRDHPSIASRIGDLVDTSDGAIALPGSLGTATELLVAWNRAYIDSLRDVTRWPIVAVGAPWHALVPHLVSQLGTGDGLISLAEDGERAVEIIVEILGRPV